MSWECGDECIWFFFFYWNGTLIFYTYCTVHFHLLFFLNTGRIYRTTYRLVLRNFDTENDILNLSITCFRCGYYTPYRGNSNFWHRCNNNTVLRVCVESFILTGQIRNCIWTRKLNKKWHTLKTHRIHVSDFFFNSLNNVERYFETWINRSWNLH